MTTGFDRLAELAELRLEFARAARWDALEPLDAERAALVPTLPAAGPADRPALERCLAAEGQVAALARAGMAEVRHELTRLGRGRGVVRAYGQLGATASVGPLA